MEEWNDLKKQLKTCNPKRLWLKTSASINEVIREEKKNIQAPSYARVRKINYERLVADPLVDMIKECVGKSDAYLSFAAGCKSFKTIKAVGRSDSSH